jgi:hypothetical protein
MLLRYPDLRHDGLALSADLFSLGEHRAIFSAWRDSLHHDEIRDALLRDAFHDCVRRIELRRLTQAKQASTAALSEPDLQPYMSAAVEEAILLQETRSGEQPAETLTTTDNRRAQEIAASLVEDEEMGKKLHQAALGSRSAQRAEGSPQSEVER